MKRYIQDMGLEQAFPDHVFPLIELHYYDKGECLCRTGDTIGYFHIIVFGKCRVTSASEDGKEVLINYLSKMSLNGDIELLSECEAMSSVYADTAVTVLAVERNVFLREMMQIPGFLQVVCKSLAVMLTDSTHWHSSNMLYPIRVRLSRLLLSTAKQQGDTFRIKLVEVAQLLGVSTHHLRRMLTTYEEQHVIRRARNLITLLDKDALRQESGLQGD